MRLKNLLKNFISEILPQVLILFLGIFKSKIFLNYLGESTTGLVSVFSQVMAYLSLAEGGLGQAVIYRLYKPVVKKDWNQISKIKNGTKTIFNIVMLIMFIASIIGGLIIPFLIKSNTFSSEYIVFNFVIYVISELILYITIFERSLYIATENAYKSNGVIKTALLIKKIVEIGLAILLKNITVIFLAYIAISLIETIIILSIFKKDFPQTNKSTESDFSVLKDTKDLIVHKVAGLVASNIDILLISSNIGLAKVVVYSTYYTFVSAVTSLLNKISSAFLGTVGNVIEEVGEESYRTFQEYNGFLFFIAMTIGGPFEFIINYFINIFYDGKVETSIIISLLFTISLIYSIIRIPLVTYTEGGGLFKQTKICPIIECIVNLALSIILIKYLGISGCLLGTIISLIISEYLIKPRIIFKELFKKDVFEYYKMNSGFILALIIQLMFSIMTQQFIKINNMLQLIMFLIIYFIINMIFTILIFYVFKQNYMKTRFIQLKNMIFRREKNEKRNY